MGGGELITVLGWFAVKRPSNMLTHLRDGQALNIVSVATLSKKLQINLAISVTVH